MFRLVTAFVTGKTSKITNVLAGCNDVTGVQREKPPPPQHTLEIRKTETHTAQPAEPLPGSVLAVSSGH